MNNEHLNWLEKPVLKKPCMIIGFSGWSNAAEVASSVLWYLLSRFESTLFAELRPDEFYTYHSHGQESKRPLVVIEEGIIKSFSQITLNFWAHKAQAGGKDLLLVSGLEPELGWNKLAHLFINIARDYDVERIVALGSNLDVIPHTVPPKISGVVNMSSGIDELKEMAIELTSYQGPSSLYSLIMVEAARQNVPMTSLWVHTPHYLQVTNFIGCYYMMLKLTEILGINIDLNVAKKDSEYLFQQIDLAVKQKPELQEYVKTLETEFHKGSKPQESPINKNIIKEIEDLFKDKPA